AHVRREDALLRAGGQPSASDVAVATGGALRAGSCRVRPPAFMVRFGPVAKRRGTSLDYY
ncbi:MAG: hypothetical protein U0J70_09490, partial [Atopobiaceae bacterium]|nr:hypothetical protein [Atopobiaceae bacterium]